MGKLFVDITPLRQYPEFRRLWMGSMASSVGTQLSVVALAYEVYHVSGSDLDVGLVSLVQLVPALLGSLLGGAIADALDRRRLLVVTGITLAAAASGLAYEVSRRHPSLLIIYAIAAVAAALQALNGPASTALSLSTIDRASLLAANSLSQASRQITTVLGPSLAGVLISAFSPSLVFVVNAFSFLIPVLAVLTVRPRAIDGGRTRFGWSSILEGFRFLRGRQAIQGCFIADLNATVLGMPTALFPAMAKLAFHGGAPTVGLLYAAPSVGALVVGGLSGWTARIRRPGAAVCWCIAIWGVALIAFGLVRSVAIALVCLVIAGAADMISAIFRSTIIQTEAPDRLRGRLSSIQFAVVQSGPRLGNTEAGLVAAATNTQFSVVSGGIGCVVGIAIIARLLPKFFSYEPHASGEDRSTVADGSGGAASA